MTALSFGPVRTRPDVAPQPSPRPVRLTVFGECMCAGLIGIALVGAPWLATGLGNWLAGRLS